MGHCTIGLPHKQSKLAEVFLAQLLASFDLLEMRILNVLIDKLHANSLLERLLRSVYLEGHELCSSALMHSQRIECV